MRRVHREKVVCFLMLQRRLLGHSFWPMGRLHPGPWGVSIQRAFWSWACPFRKFLVSCGVSILTHAACPFWVMPGVHSTFFVRRATWRSCEFLVSCAARRAVRAEGPRNRRAASPPRRWRPATSTAADRHRAARRGLTRSIAPAIHPSRQPGLWR